MPTVTHILAAVDLSGAAPLVMTYARHMAGVWKARLTVLHVVHDLSYYSGVFITSKPLKTLQHDLEIEASERLEAWCHDVFGSEISYDALVVEGRPAAEISRMVRELEADCLVIGAHRMDKPEHQIFGSTAERLLHHIQCPTVVIPLMRVPMRVDDVAHA